MKKELLIRFVSNQTNEQESAAVLDWAERSPANAKYLQDLKLAYIAEKMPDSPATEQEMRRMRDALANAKHSSGHGQVRTYRIIAWVSAAAAAVALLLFALKPSVNNPKNVEKVRQEVAEEMKHDQIRIAMSEIPEAMMRTVYTERGIKASVALPDGSTVKLNSDTKLTFPDKFLGSTREVKLEGEAYFIVAKDSAHPMIVNTTKNFAVKVTGTEFNVKSYANDDYAEATLYSGSIDLITPKGETAVAPRQQAFIRPDESVRIVAPAILNNTKAWTEGRLVFDSTPMPEVVKMLERWHGIDVVIRDPNVLKYKITANFNSESVPQIMYVLKNCALIDYQIDGKTVYLFSRSR
jgi:transmembrane sensor